MSREWRLYLADLLLGCEKIQRYPKLEWRKIAGMRDWIAHACFGIDPDILWDVIENKVPELRSHVLAWSKGNAEDTSSASTFIKPTHAASAATIPW